MQDFKNLIEEAKANISDIEILLNECIEILNSKIEDNCDDDLIEVVENLETIKGLL